MGIDRKLFGLPSEHACTRLKRGWLCDSNNTFTVSICKISLRGILSALVPN